ncbi:alpha/beta hydrolase [Nocardia stercoris]|uniref:Alpha/beta hydrolase n=2 Tax=Nocardia stercoris TaxID=2483361 RepID=A0A3M2LBC3_9NOCA|nr:alpha/beta hydrolase [Nocardia stercoris]
MRSLRRRRNLGAAALLASAAVLAAAGTVTAAPIPDGAGAPGTVIASTAEPDGWHTVSGGERIDYWTRNSDGSAVPASGALVVPPGPAPAGGWPILAWDHGTSGFGPGCGGQADPAKMPFESEAVRGDEMFRYFLAHGFAVLAPDYIGLGDYATGPHPYLEIRSEGTATIDLVRAARLLHPELSRTWAVMGQSQGGQVALATSWVQRTDAPELDFRGTVTIDPESHFDVLLPALGGPDFHVNISDGVTVFTAGALAGLRATHPELDLDSYLSPTGRAVLDDVGGLCLDGMATRVAGLDVGQLLSKPLSDPAFRAALTEYAAVPVTGYDAPILELANLADVTVPSPLHLVLAGQLATGGNDFRLVTGTGEHVHLSPEMWAAIDEWTARVLSTPPVS